MEEKYANKEILTAGIALVILVFSANVVMPAVMAAVLALKGTSIAIGATTIGASTAGKIALGAFAAGGATGTVGNAVKNVLGWQTLATALTIIAVGCVFVGIGFG
ncbi:MAG: hypothetical protein QW734_10775 [Candidatus Bathyarchaeia archaeon]